MVDANWDNGLATLPNKASKVADMSICGVVPPVEVIRLVVPITEVTPPALIVALTLSAINLTAPIEATERGCDS